MQAVNKEQIQKAITDLSKVIVKGSGHALTPADLNAIIRARVILAGLLKVDK